MLSFGKLFILYFLEGFGIYRHINVSKDSWFGIYRHINVSKDSGTKSDYHVTNETGSQLMHPIISPNIEIEMNNDTKLILHLIIQQIN